MLLFLVSGGIVIYCVVSFVRLKLIASDPINRFMRIYIL